MNAIVIIKRDHRAVERAYENYKRAKTDEKKLEYAEEILNSLDAHARMEEKYFYPALEREDDEGESMAKEAYLEHAGVKKLIARLRKLPAGARLTVGLAALMRMVQHHVKEEEREILPYAEEMLGRSALMELGEKMQPLSGVEKAA